ncbi:hypothetical protein MTO96_042583 [Rhipicephalus appendiculatus]
MFSKTTIIISVRVVSGVGELAGAGLWQDCRGAAQRSPRDALSTTRGPRRKRRTRWPPRKKKAHYRARKKKVLRVNAKTAETTAMTEKGAGQIDASAVPEIASGPLGATEEQPEVSPPPAKPSQRATVSPPEEPKPKSQPDAIQPQSQEHFYMVLLEDVLSADQGQRGRRDGSDASGSGPNNGGGGAFDREGRRLAEPLDPIADNMCDERFSRAFGLPLLGLAFITIVLPMALHHYSSAQNDTTQSSQLRSTPNRFYPSPRPVHFNYFADSILMASGTTPRHAEAWQRYNSSGISRIILDWQRLLGVKYKTNTTATTARTSKSSTKWQNMEHRESSPTGSTSRNAYGALPTSGGVYRNVDANERPYWLPPIGPQNLLAQTRRFFEKKSRDSSAAGDEHPHDTEVEYDVRKRGRDQGLPHGDSVPETDGAAQRGNPGGATTGEPVPPLSGSQLWCVYQPAGGAHEGTAAADDDEYQLDDVPVSLCTAVVYCCLDVWRHGVRMYQPSTARPRGPPGGRWYGECVTSAR